MAGRRPFDVEQSRRAAPARFLRCERAPGDAPYTDQGRRTDCLTGPEESMRLHEITLRPLRLPLHRPYRLSYRIFTEFEPIIVEVRGSDGGIGWGEGHISPGSSRETREGGWAFAREHAAKILGMDTREAKAVLSASMGASKVAATALLTAIEMLESHPLLSIERET